MREVGNARVPQVSSQDQRLQCAHCHSLPWLSFVARLRSGYPIPTDSIGPRCRSTRLGTRSVLRRVGLLPSALRGASVGPSPMTPTEIAQRILNGKWRHASAALRACQRGEWADFARAVAPARPLLAGRLDHGRCLTLAERSLTGPVMTKLTLVPLWACSTEDALSADWVAVHGVAQAGKPLHVQEAGPFIAVEDASPRADALWECSVRRWTAAAVVGCAWIRRRLGSGAAQDRHPIASNFRAGNG